MVRWCGAHGVVAILIASASTAAVSAATKTYVTFPGRDDAIPKLGLPGIALRVDAPRPDEAGAVSIELARELARQVHARKLAAGERGDYDLDVTVAVEHIEGAAIVIPFEAILSSAQGERLWRIEGRAEVESAPVDASVFVGIGRNVMAALVHDGWVAPRLDPDDPPPQPPRVRLESDR